MDPNSTIAREAMSALERAVTGTDVHPSFHDPASVADWIRGYAVANARRDEQADALEAIMRDHAERLMEATLPRAR